MRPAFLKKQSMISPNYLLNEQTPSNYAMKDL